MILLEYIFFFFLDIEEVCDNNIKTILLIQLKILFADGRLHKKNVERIVCLSCMWLVSTRYCV